ncbi:MAG TPA: glutathione S-transferase family protein [Candidatus Binataceae bacterium]|nr:glutathione S-transferase family protein [Candidatus Binataceae bacterium]
MAEQYRVYGVELSPYSIKVRSYFRYKKIPHEWLIRNASNEAEFQKHAKLPLVPLVITPAGEGVQDSTPIIERFEREFPDPPINPADPALNFISALIEEYGDEWGNKWMFHYRWWYEPDQISCARRIAQGMMPGAKADAIEQATKAIQTRMVPRISFVGSSAATKDIIERSFLHTLAIIERHLEGRKYLIGARPAFADFGLYSQIYQASTDPTPGAIIRKSFPRTLAWAERMLTPEAGGDFEPWDRLAPTLTPLLKDEVGALFLPWTAANAKAVAAGEKEYSLPLGGGTWTQAPQKYHAKSFEVLRKRYASVADKSKLDPILRESGCLKWLA